MRKRLQRCLIIGSPMYIPPKVQDGKQVFHVKYHISNPDEDDMEHVCRKRLKAAAAGLKLGLHESTAVWPHTITVRFIGAEQKTFSRRVALGTRARRLFGGTSRPLSHPLELGHQPVHPMQGHQPVHLLHLWSRQQRASVR